MVLTYRTTCELPAAGVNVRKETGESQIMNETFRRAKSMTRPSRALIGVAAVASTVLLAACGGGSSSTPAAADATSTITVGVPAAITADAVTIAQQQGFFTNNHLKVNVKTVNGGSDSVPALQGGAIQVAQSNVFSEIQGATNGLDVPCFAGASGIPTNGTLLPLLASPKAAITKPADLVGKTIAVNATGGVNELMTRAWLGAQGVDYTKVKFISTPFPNMPQVLSTGQVAAAVPVDPFATQMLGNGAQLLVSDLEANIEGRPLYACWNATSDWLSKNPQVAKSFVAAIQQANDYINSQPARFRAFVVQDSKIPAPVVEKISIPLFTTTMSAADVHAWVAAGAKYGILKDTTVDVAKVYRPLTG